MKREFNSLPKEKILDTSKLKEFADNNFKFIEDGRKLSKQVENTVVKWEIARYEQFLLFLQCFQKKLLIWERVNSLPNEKILDLTKLKAFADDKSNVA